MSDDVIISIVTAVLGPVSVIVVGVVVKRLGDKVSGVAVKTERVRAQVENSHQTNLREESDERHSAQMQRLGQIVDTQKELRRDMGGVRQDIRTLKEADLVLARQQADDRARIGDTLTPEEKAQVRAMLAERRK